MNTYEKPIVELIDFNLEYIMDDPSIEVGPSGVEEGGGNIGEGGF